MNHNKKEFIKTVCRDLQDKKRRYNEYAKRCKYKTGYFSVSPFSYNNTFDVVENNTIERWTINAWITNCFEIRFCEMVKYSKRYLFCNNVDCNHKTDNIFENITEFRKFLEREVHKNEN